MTSDKKIASNRRNALKSPGPSSQSGKLRARFNALKYGMFAKLPLIPGEDEKEYTELVRNLNEEYNPKTTMEQMLVDQIANDLWRLKRIDVAEGRLHEETSAKLNDRMVESLSDRQLKVYLSTTSLKAWERNRVDAIRARMDSERKAARNRLAMLGALAGYDREIEESHDEEVPADEPMSLEEVQTIKLLVDEKVRAASDPGSVLLQGMVPTGTNLPFEHLDRMRQNLMRGYMQKLAALIKLREDRYTIEPHNGEEPGCS